MTKAKAGPYSRVYGPWREAWTSAGISGRELGAMLALCEHLEFDAGGNATAWCSHDELAREWGCSTSNVRNVFSKLKSRGLVSVKAKGHRGLATVYRVMPGVPWPDKKGSTSRWNLYEKGSTNPMTKVPPIDGTHKKKTGGSSADAADRQGGFNDLFSI